MSRRRVLSTILCVYVFSSISFADGPGKVDFRRDVQPLFQANCIGCHGPSLQMNGFRLDRRRDAMKGGTSPVIGPGNSAGSKLYLRLIGNRFGLQMPPTGALKLEEINIIKAWIDQGAEWPDDLSGEKQSLPPSPQATRMMDALRDGNRGAFLKMLNEDRAVANLQARGGSTPLMYAALYGEAASVRLLLSAGADPNVHNEAGATALMWAVDDLEKTRLLLKAGADPNARSDDGRSPLLIAAGRFGAAPIVKLLLDHGANLSAKSRSVVGDVTPLSEAAYVGDDEVLRILIDRGADIKAAGVAPLFFAVNSGCGKCVDLLINLVDRTTLNRAMLALTPPRGNAEGIKVLLDRGADVNAKDRDGLTILMLAASSDALPLEAVKLLIKRGADVNARGAGGETALDFAQQRGNTAIVDLLTGAGAKATTLPAPPALQPVPAHSVRAAVERSLPLLERTGVNFLQKSGCVSCHNNSLTAMTMVTAQQNGFTVNNQIAAEQLKKIGTYIEGWRERALQGVGIPGDADSISYILLGMASANYPPDAATDAFARYLKGRQLPDGRWWIFAHRPPIESSEIQVTATAMRALQVYAPKAQRGEYARAAVLAGAWLAKAQPKTTEDRAFQLLGLQWAALDNNFIRKFTRELCSEQRPDGGWAQLPSLESDAYATGQALVALKMAGGMAVNDPIYQRGSEFLRRTQQGDGSWFVKSRALPIQPFFENGFPYGHDQWISAAATNWATMALASAAEGTAKGKMAVRASSSLR